MKIPTISEQKRVLAMLTTYPGESDKLLVNTEKLRANLLSAVEKIIVQKKKLAGNVKMKKIKFCPYCGASDLNFSIKTGVELIECLACGQVLRKKYIENALVV